MSPENVCPRFKQNAWKKELCSNCFRPKEEHPEKPKRVHVDYKPLPEISPAQSILKANGSCDKSRNVSFSNVESEVIGYGGEEYSTDDEDYSDDEYHSECADSDDDEELKRLTEANTNLNGKLTAPEKSVGGNGVRKSAADDNSRAVVSAKPVALNATAPSPPRVTVQPFNGDPPKSLVFNFLKNKELAAAAAANAAATVCSTAPADKEAPPPAKVEETRDGDGGDDGGGGGVQLRKTESTRKPSLTRSSLVANSNEPYLNMKRRSLQADDRPDERTPRPPVLASALQDIPTVKLHPPEAAAEAVVEKDHPAHEAENDVSSAANAAARESDADVAAGGVASFKTRGNVPRMGTMLHFKLKLAVATSQKPEPSKPVGAGTADSTPESSLTSREMAGEPDGKADSDEPGDPTTTTTTTTAATAISNTTSTASAAVTPANRSFLHNYKESSPPLRDSTTPPRTPPKKTSITSSGSSPPECPRSIKRQAPKPPPPPPSSAKCAAVEPSSHAYHSADSSDDEFRPDELSAATNRRLLAEYCELIDKEPPRPSSAGAATVSAAGTDEAPPSSPPPPPPPPLPRAESAAATAGKRPAYEKKKYGKAGKVGLKIKKFLRIPSRDSATATAPRPAPRPKLEIIHPLDMNKSGVEIIHNSAEGLFPRDSAPKTLVSCNHHHYPVRPSKPPPPPRSLPPIAKVPPKTSSAVPSVEIIEVADYLDAPKTCDSSASDETYEPVNFSAPECDHSSPEMARLTSMQYYGSETESEIYPTIQFGDDFGAEDSIRNTQPGHKSLEESYDAVVIANHEALTKLLDQATCGPKVPRELAALKTKSLEWSSFHVDPTSRLSKSGYAFYNGKWYDVPVVLSVSSERVELNKVLNNHFTLTKVTEFVARVGKDYSPGAENEEAYVTLWNAHHVEAIESYCKEYNAKYADVTKEAGLILVETVNLLMGLQASDVERYSLDPFVVTRNCTGADPTVAVVQLDTHYQDTLCDVMLKVLLLLAPTWEMTVCLAQVLRQNRPNSLSKCKALLEFWLWGPTGATVTPDRPMSLKRWLDLERANELHGHVCSRSDDLSAERACYMSFLVVADDGALYSDAWAALADHLKTRPPRDPTISKC